MSPLDGPVVGIAPVIRLHPPRSCFDCIHFGDREDEEDPASGVFSFCMVYSELIDSETYSAADCEAYEVET